MAEMSELDEDCDGSLRTTEDCRMKYTPQGFATTEPSRVERLGKDPLEPYASWGDAKAALDLFVKRVRDARDNFAVPDVVLAFGATFRREGRVEAFIAAVSIGDPMRAELLATKAMAVAGEERRKTLDGVLRPGASVPPKPFRVPDPKPIQGLRLGGDDADGEPPAQPKHGHGFKHVPCETAGEWIDRVRRTKIPLIDAPFTAIYPVDPRDGGEWTRERLESFVAELAPAPRKP